MLFFGGFSGRCGRKLFRLIFCFKTVKEGSGGGFLDFLVFHAGGKLISGIAKGLGLPGKDL